MDEMKIRLSTKFMRGIITKLISRAIFNKYGYSIDIQLKEIEMENKEGKITIHANVDAEMETEVFAKIVKTVGLD